MTDELDPSERDALDTWAPMTPPNGFADRVLAAREIAPARKRWPLVAGLVAATAAAAAIAFMLLRAPSHHAAQGELAAQPTRVTKSLGERPIAVAEPQATLAWRIDDDGDAVIEQRAGDVFYRVEPGGSFVVHTPVGDVRVTGTCFRIEVTMNRTKQLLLSGTVGAAIATGIVVTVYEGHVIADSKTGSRAEIAAGHRGTLSSDGRTVVDDRTPTTIAMDDNVTREQLITRTHIQQSEIVKLRTRVAELEAAGDNHGDNEHGEDGRPWHDPSPEKLKEWAAACHVRNDEPGLDRWKPSTDLGKNERGLEPSELPQVNATFTELQKEWKQLVRALYIEATGDMQGADVLSSDAMRKEIEEKSAPEEHSLLLQRISAERAGMAQPPADLSKTSPYERLLRAYFALGDKAEAALAKRVGADRARAIRGEGWSSRWDMSGCPSKD
jgi:hypothetical protein